MLGDFYGYMILLVVYDFIDDIVLIFKLIFLEILGKVEDLDLGNIIFMVNDLNVCIVFLYLFEGQFKLLFLLSYVDDLELFSEFYEICKIMSKKDVEVRCKELVVFMFLQMLVVVVVFGKEFVVILFGC